MFSLLSMANKAASAPKRDGQDPAASGEILSRQDQGLALLLEEMRGLAALIPANRNLGAASLRHKVAG